MNTLEALVGQMTVRELAQRSGRSIDAIASFVLNGTKPKQISVERLVKAVNTTTKPAQTVASPSIDTSTSRKRKAYDVMVLAHLKNQPKGTRLLAQQIRKVVGGTPLQVRTSLQRLYDMHKVDCSGNARATVYWATIAGRSAS